MENVHNRSTSGNTRTTPPSDSLPPDFLFQLRNQLLEVCALAGAAADAVGALPAGSVDETTQALCNVTERSAREALAKVEQASAAADGPKADLTK